MQENVIEVAEQTWRNDEVAESNIMEHEAERVHDVLAVTRDRRTFQGMTILEITRRKEMHA